MLREFSVGTSKTWSANSYIQEGGIHLSSGLGENIIFNNANLTLHSLGLVHRIFVLP